MKSIRALTLSSLFVASLAACSSPTEFNTTLIEDDTNENVLEVSQSLALSAANAWTGTRRVASGNTERIRDLSVNVNGVSLVGQRGELSSISATGTVTGLFVNTYKAFVTTDRNYGYTANLRIEDGRTDSLARAAKIGLVTPDNLLGDQFVDAPLDDGPSGIGVDAQGNFYLGGYTCGGQSLDGQKSAGFCDHFITKISATNVRLWTRLLGSSGNEITGKLSVSSNGSVVVTGTTTGSMPGHRNAGGQDVYVARFDTNGNRQWVRQFGTPQDETGVDVAFDFAGGVYVTGMSKGAFVGQTRYKNVGVNDGFVMRLNSSNGTPYWTKNTSLAYGFAGCVGKKGCGRSDTKILDLAVDGNSNVYLVGDSLNDSTGALGIDNFGNMVPTPSNDIAWPIRFNSSGALTSVTRNSPVLQAKWTADVVAVAPGGVYVGVSAETFDNVFLSDIYRYDFNLNLTR
jgi:Beta-propeller repeat